MALIKKLGIWMDHASAHLMEIMDGAIITSIIAPKYNAQGDQIFPTPGDNKLSEYYKRISDAIVLYRDVLLFGPAPAKDELYRYLKDHHTFDNIKFEVIQSDYMTEHQELAFVRSFFKNKGINSNEN